VRWRDRHRHKRLLRNTGFQLLSNRRKLTALGVLLATRGSDVQGRPLGLEAPRLGARLQLHAMNGLKATPEGLAILGVACAAMRLGCAR